MALDDVVILNVDSNTLETPFDDLQNLPNDVVRVYTSTYTCILTLLLIRNCINFK